MSGRTEQLRHPTRGHYVTTWCEEDLQLIRERFEAGDLDAEIAERVGCDPAQVKSQRVRMGLNRKDIPGTPFPPGWQSGRAYSPYWTRERVIDALKGYAVANPGELPRGTPAWDEITRGNAELPTSARVLELFGALGLAWREVLGERHAKRRVPIAWVRYTPAEDEFIESQLGRMSMGEIADRLGRTEGSVSMHAKRRGLTLERVREWWTPADVAEFYGCPITRVYKLVSDGELRARKRGRVEIDPRALPGVAGDHDRRAAEVSREEMERIEELLRAPSPGKRPRRPDDVITRYRSSVERLTVGGGA